MAHRLPLVLSATAFLAAAGVATALPARADISTAAPLPLAAGGCRQTFDSLAGTGTSAALPAGFGVLESGTSGAADQSYAANDGSSTGGNAYSYGTTGTTDRALGSLSSGTNLVAFGVLVRNDTGTTVSSLGLSFTMEQWRRGSATPPNTTPFSFSTTATGLGGAGFTPLPAADLVGLATTPVDAAKDGNAAANRTAVTATITGLSIAPGGTIALRWADANDTGSDDGLSIDDLSLVPNGSGTASTACPATAPGGPTTARIHEIQGAGATSPVAGQSRTIDAIVTGLDDEVGASFGTGNSISTFPTDRGFFVQEEDAEADADPATSEGIFVGLTSASTALPAIGDRVQLTGTVRDGTFPPAFGQTRIETASFTVVSPGNALPALVTIDPARAAAQAVGTGGNPVRSYYETLEGMRVRLAVGTARSGGLNKFGEAFLVPGTGGGTLLRTDPVEPALLATAEDAGSGNPANPFVPPAPSSTRVLVDQGGRVADLVGPFAYSFGHYKVVPQVGALPVVDNSVAVTYPYDRLPAAAAGQRRIATFNVRNLFPTGGALDGTIITAAEFDERLDRTADAIGRLLQAPDVIAVQEIGDNMHLGQSGSTDSQATLQQLADRLGTLGHGSYAAHALEGNDNRGIDVGFLVKDTVPLLAGPDQRGGLTAAGSCSDVSGRLFDRPPLFIKADLGSLGTPWLVANHWASKAAPDSCRDAQADFVLARVQELRAAGDEVIVLGDLNAFEDETPLARLTAGGTLTNLFASAPPRDRYSFQFNGVLQTLDHVLVTPGVAGAVGGFQYAHISNDFFDRGVRTDGHQTSDHDPVVLTLGAATPAPVVPELPGGLARLAGLGGGLAGLAVLGRRVRRRRAA